MSQQCRSREMLKLVAVTSWLEKSYPVLNPNFHLGVSEKSPFNRSIWVRLPSDKALRAPGAGLREYLLE